ncbi:autotransporter domain-containing protein [Fusobacterium varium]
MIEKIMKAVKSSNKKRSRNITIGAVIGFLLSCTAVMGEDNYLWIKGDSGEIKFNTEKTTKVDGSDEGNWSTTNLYSDNNWDTGTKTYTNNTTLSSNGANGKDGNKEMSYGLRLSGDLNDMNFINNSSITGEISGSGSGSGYGIYNNNSEIKNITNTGEIRGSGSGTGTGTGYSYSSGIGYGIYNNNSEIKNITNTGEIRGSGTSTGIGYSSGSGTGYGIYNNNSEIKNITNTGEIRGSGYGILNSAKMGNIENTGEIRGYGYGIFNLAKMGNIENTGEIRGSGYGYGSDTGYSSGYGSGYGIFNYLGIIEDITNTGEISGYGYGSGTGNGNGHGNGIYNNNSEIKNIKNTGEIRGSGSGSGSDSGYGIYNNNSEIKNIKNTGVIYGTNNAIKNDGFGTINTVNNYGILVNGKDQNVNAGIDGVNGTNYGLIIQNGKDIVDKNKVKDEVKEDIKEYNDNGTVKSIREMTIKNETGSNSFGGDKKDHILNALTNTYKVIGENDKVTGSIINAYGTAIVFGEGNKQLTLSGTIVNGGIDENDSKPGTKVAAILGSSNGDNLILQSGKIKYTINGVEKYATQNTVVNGNINMGAGADTLTIGDGTIINGILDGGDNASKDTLNFGVSSGAKSIPGESQGINIMHNITNFENINVGENTNVTLFEKTIGADGKETALKVTGVEEINIKAGGVLNLRIDSQTIKNGRYEGHALFNENTNLTINGDISQLPGGKTEIKETEIEKYKVGVFNLITNGLGINSIIAMNGITLNANLFVKTNSILDKAVILEEPEGDEGKGEKGDIKIEGKQDIFEIEKSISNEQKYIKLQDIFEIEKSISNEQKYIKLQDIFEIEKSISNEQKYIKLNEIYKGIYSSEVENFNALKDILTLNVARGDYTSVTDKEQLAILLSYLSNIYTETPYSFSSELSRKSMGMFRDIVTENQFRPDMNKWLIMGGLTHRDGGTKDTYYGKNYYGFDTGTADVDVDMKLTGAYALGKYGYSENVSLGVTAGGNRSEAKLPMSKVKGNSGYIGAFAENYRGNLILKAGAGIQYSEYDANRATLGGHSYSDKYSDMAYDIYLNGRYSHNIGENLFLEPYGTLSYTYIKQDSADEGSKVLAIETDSKSFDYTAAKVGVDLKKVIPHEKGKSTLSAGVSYTRLLTGADEENITGRFKGGSDFDILVAHKNEHSIGLNAKYALELENGILFDVKGSYNVERDSHNGSGKNRAKGEWIVGAGIGYKF